MDRHDFCPITAATDLLGQKWTLLILHYLHAAPGRLRFCELQEQLGGLNPSTLSQRLKQLESAGLVERREVTALPARVEYGLTKMGAELGPAVDNLNQWGRKWLSPARPRTRARNT
jgi:DNA-binding HxlR family transcriptional regulator